MFSRLLHGQIVYANSLEDIIMVWNGEDINDINYYFSNDDDDDDDDDVNNNTDDSDSDNNNNKHIDIILLFSECFYYQLRSLPTWEALSFHYQRSALDPFLSPVVVVVPSKAFIMAAAFELIDLCVSHGDVGRLLLSLLLLLYLIIILIVLIFL